MSNYRTNSLPLASYLCTRGDLTFEGVNKNDPRNIAFVFSPSEKAQIAADDYFAGKKIEISPLDIFKNYRNLKDLVFEVKRNNSDE